MRALIALGLVGCAGAPGNEPIVTEPPEAEIDPPELEPLLPTLDAWRARRPDVSAVGYLKGALHVHTKHSGDSTTVTSAVVRYYDRAGFDFVVLTDHNRITDPALSELAGTDILVFPGVELTNNPARCIPPPPEERGRCRIHVNALFLQDYSSHAPDQRPVRHQWRERKSKQRADQYEAAFRFARDRGGLIMINHPTWFWGTDGALLAELGRRGAQLVEVANTAFTRWNAGDGEHPGTEAIWDVALTAGHKMWGVATDDAHHYRQAEIDRRLDRGKPVYPGPGAGGGFVMVRARPTMLSIRSAIERGDFYSSTGVLLDRAEVSGDTLVVEVAASQRGDHRIEVIGDGGEVLERVDGESLRFDLARAKSYARAVVTAADGARAWVQPAFRRPSRAEAAETPPDPR